MKTRTYMAGTLSLIINAVLFGAGTILVLSIPELAAQAIWLIPAVVILSLMMTPFIAWNIAPALRLDPEKRNR